MIPEYLYTPAQGWALIPPGAGWLATMAPHATEPGLAFAEADYVPLAASHAAGLGVGAFLVWQAPPSRPVGWPRYAVEILQYEDECVVWVQALPALWDFLRRYGTIGVSMQPTVPGAEEEGEDAADADGAAEAGGGFAICADCYATLAAPEPPDSVWDGVAERGPHDDA